MRLRLLALLVPALVAVSSSTAHAALPGVNVIGDLGSNSLLDRALQTHAKELRFFVNWGTFEASAPNDWLSPGATKNEADGTFAAMKRAHDAGAKVLVNITGAPKWASGKDDANNPPTPDHVADYANFAAAVAKHAADGGYPIDSIEIWNEPDGTEFWQSGPDPGAYTNLLKAAYAKIKDPASGDPRTQVLTGPTTGNNYDWIQKLYDNGAKGSFDGVSVHTDTACLTSPPDSFYRDNATGKLGQFTFLGYREIRKVMLAQGDDKPIVMSEVGWSSTNGGATSCARGASAGQKPDGVSEAAQASNLTKAFQCLANDSYVTFADWFYLQDSDTYPLNEIRHYGLFDTKGATKPAFNAFQSVADANGGAAGPCGDFDPPTLKVVSPTPGQQFVDRLDLQASGSDSGVGLFRISFYVDGATDPVINFGSADKPISNDQVVGLTPWFGSRQLALGAHTIRAEAVDANGNKTSQTIQVTKVDPAAITSTLTPKLSLTSKKVACIHRRCTIRAKLAKGRSGTPTIGGHVAVEWQFFNHKHQWRKQSGGLKRADKSPFVFTAVLRHPGRWRVRIVYQGLAPWKQVTSKFLYFRLT